MKRKVPGVELLAKLFPHYVFLMEIFLIDESPSPINYPNECRGGVYYQKLEMLLSTQFDINPRCFMLVGSLFFPKQETLKIIKREGRF